MKNGSFSALKYCIGKLNLLSESYKSMGLTKQTDDTKMSPEQRSKYIDWFTQEDEWEENNPEEALASYKADSYASGDDITQDDRLARLKRTTTPMVAQKKQWLQDTPLDPAIHKGRESKGSYHDFVLDDDGKLYDRFSTDISTESGKYRDGNKYAFSTDVRKKAGKYKLPGEDKFSTDPEFIDVSDRVNGQELDKFENEFIPDADVRDAMTDEDRNAAVKEGMEKMIDIIIDTGDFMALPDRKQLKEMFGIRTAFGGSKKKKKDENVSLIYDEPDKPKNRPSEVVYKEFLEKVFNCDACYPVKRRKENGTNELCYLVGKAKNGAWYCASFVTTNRYGDYVHAPAAYRRLYFFNAPISDTIFNLGEESGPITDATEIEAIKQDIEDADSVEQVVTKFVDDFMIERQAVGARESRILEKIATAFKKQDIIIKLGEPTINSSINENKKIKAVTLYKVEDHIGVYLMVAKEIDGSYRVIKKPSAGYLDNPVTKITDICTSAITDTLENDPKASKDKLIEAIANDIAYSYGRVDINSLLEKVASKTHAQRAKKATKGDGAMYSPFANLDTYLDPDRLPKWEEGDPLATDAEHAAVTAALQKEVDKDVADTLAGLKPIADLGETDEITFDDDDIAEFIASSEMKRRPDTISGNDEATAKYAQKSTVFKAKAILLNIIRKMPGFLDFVSEVTDDYTLRELMHNFNADDEKADEFAKLPMEIREDLGMIYFYLMLATGNVPDSLIEHYPQLKPIEGQEDEKGQNYIGRYILHNTRSNKQGKTTTIRPVAFSSFVKKLKEDYPELEIVAQDYKTKSDDDEEAGYKNFYEDVVEGQIDTTSIKRFHPYVIDELSERGDESPTDILDRFFSTFKTKYSYAPGDKKKERAYNVTREVNYAVEIIYSLITGSISELIKSKRARQVTIIQIDNIVRHGILSADKLGKAQEGSTVVVTRGSSSRPIIKGQKTDPNAFYLSGSGRKKTEYSKNEYNGAIRIYNSLKNKLIMYNDVINDSLKAAKTSSDGSTFRYSLKDYYETSTHFNGERLPIIKSPNVAEVFGKILFYFDVIDNALTVEFMQRYPFLRAIVAEYKSKVGKEKVKAMVPIIKDIIRQLLIIDAYTMQKHKAKKD